MKLIILLIILLAAVKDGFFLSLDPVASNDLEQFIKDDFTLSLRHIRPRRKFQISIEALFMIDFPGQKNKFSFYLDRKNKRVTIDIGTLQQTVSKHLDVSQFNETTTIRSLIFSFQQNFVTLYVDCKEVTKQNLDLNLSQLYLDMDEPVVKLFRERKYPLHFDSKVDNAISRSNCDKRTNRKGNRRYLKENGQSEKLLRQNRKETKLLKFDRDLDSEIIRKKKDGNKKRDIRNWQRTQQEQPANEQEDINDIHRRGDIPVIHGDCDDTLTKALTELFVIVKQLREEISKQKTEIHHLRYLLENCAGCRGDRPDISVQSSIRETCENSNDCYPGAQCHDTVSGIRCGACPRGYVGDGKKCKPGYTCADRPCFAGVQCRDTVDGAECHTCPSGYEGDGRTCTLTSQCDKNPCYSGVHCSRTDSSPYYRCGPCPHGLTGNGVDCDDINEVIC